MVEAWNINSLHVGRITRRALLSAAANVLLLVAPSRPVAAPGLDLATFLQQSEKLTARRTSRRTLRDVICKAFSSRRAPAVSFGTMSPARRDDRIAPL